MHPHEHTAEDYGDDTRRSGHGHTHPEGHPPDYIHRHTHTALSLLGLPPHPVAPSQSGRLQYPTPLHRAEALLPLPCVPLGGMLNHWPGAIEPESKGELSWRIVSRPP